MWIIDVVKWWLTDNELWFYFFVYDDIYARSSKIMKHTEKFNYPDMKILLILITWFLHQYENFCTESNIVNF